ncbi:MAG: preprotein translocase subunit SecA [Pirellulales bacterium]|nr:preprotein translocase subunit SecA [Pirellulales bacterium]
MANEALEFVWDATSGLFGGVARGIERGITSLFGSANARFVKRLQPKVAAINALESKYQAMTEEELRDQTRIFRERLRAGETLDDLLVEAFAVCREGGRRFLGMRHYDVQLMGGMVLHSGAIAEMVTGEGKTLVATLPAYLNALEGRGVHVVTVNDYLARRDMEWMGPLHMRLGLSVGAIQGGMGGMERQKSYACDITYGTNNEFGFDYLRDNMRLAARGDDRYPKEMQQCQGPLNYAIIDEVDNILVDEARTPLIISGPAHDDVSKYQKADKIARQLKRDAHFEVKEKEHTAHLTEDGVRAAEKLAGVESFYTAGNMEWPHLIDNSLKAHHLYRRDVNYVVQQGEVVIVDEFTGRLMPGRNWSDGLHQAVEAKEGVRIKEENQTLATITLQNFFKLYKKICGMTGTAMTEATEFWKIYKLDVIAIPTNRSLTRINHPDVIYLTERDKFKAIVDEIELLHKFDSVEQRDGTFIAGQLQQENDQQVEIVDRESKQPQTIARDKVKEVRRRGRPILVGTVSIEKSERLSEMLAQRGIDHSVLNAKHHQREAEIIAQAGRKSAVTIATNMAGRGTDIILGGNSETMAWAQLQDKYPTRLDVPREEWEALIAEIENREQTKQVGREVAKLGGLHVIGTERHEARRIDLQLRGRCGRQGDPGSSRFFLSLEDDLMRIFGGEWAKNMLTRMGMQEGEAIESRLVSRRIEGAQKKVEERNFEVRKNLLEYDEVMDEQRKRVYHYRQRILDGASVKAAILDMINQSIAGQLGEFLDKDYGAATFARWAGNLLGVEFEPRDFRGTDFDAAQQLAKDQAERQVETQVHELIDENLPAEEDSAEWNWEALAKAANARWRLNLRDRDLKKVGRDDLAEALIEQGQASIQEVDLSEGQRYLAEDYGVRTACGWLQLKFGLKLEVDEVRHLDAKPFIELARQRAAAAYAEKEAEFPVLASLARFTVTENGTPRLDREKIVDWAQRRFDAALSLDELRNKDRHETAEQLIVRSRAHLDRGETVQAEAQAQVDQLFSTDDATRTLALAAGRGAADQLASWIKEQLGFDVAADELARLNREQLASRLSNMVEDRFRPEMRRLERSLVLSILDAAWKDHLLSMDRLRQSIGLRGFAQVDPKVEYKREGMQIYQQMWNSVGEQVTDLIFRMEQLDEGFVRSVWNETSAVHEEAPSTAGEIGKQQQSAIDSSQTAAKSEPIRNREDRTPRNAPCPCGSGKKFKNCCMNKRPTV